MIRQKKKENPRFERIKTGTNRRFFIEFFMFSETFGIYMHFLAL